MSFLLSKRRDEADRVTIELYKKADMKLNKKEEKSESYFIASAIQSIKAQAQAV